MTKRYDSSFFLPYQRKWIEDDSRLKLMEKSRQIGMSWTCAYGLTAETAPAEARYDAWVSSRDELQARLFLEDCARFANIFQDAAPGCEIVQSRHAQTLEFRNGRRIHSLSSSPDAQAGKRGTRVLDEFALHPDPRRLYAIAYPGITWGGRLEILSTHRGEGNFFNQLVEEITHRGNPQGFSHHRVTLVGAVEQGFLTKLKAKLPADDERQQMSNDDYLNYVRSGCPDEETWQQEFLCMPASEATAFLPYEAILKCES